MFQIDNSTAVAAIPAPTAPGALGYFTDGNPATGVSATILPAEFMNMLMMENLNVLSAGGIAPVKGQYNQLALAIAKIVQSGAAGQASETAAGILKLSTNPQAIAGTDDTTAITPLKLAQKLANYIGQATETAFGWLKIATQAIVNAGVDDAAAVTAKKLANATQAQAFTAFTTSGAPGALTLTPVPAIQAYATPLRFRVKFSQNSTGTDTINVSGQGAKSLKQYDSTGAKVAAVFAASQLADVEYDGTDVVLLDQLPSTVRQGVRGASLNWKASADGLSPSIAYSANAVTVCNAAGDAITLQSISGNLSTSDTASATVNGMASGATAVSTIYGIYVWYNPTTAAVVVTGDSSLTAPTAPAAGFTHWARRGTFKTDATGNKYPFAFIASGNKTQLDPATGRNLTDAVQVAIQSGTIGSTAVSISGTVPSTAISVDLSFRVQAVGASVAAAVTPKTSSQNMAAGISVASGATANCKQSLLISEPGLVYWGVAVTSSGTAILFVCGWEDAL